MSEEGIEDVENIQPEKSKKPTFRGDFITREFVDNAPTDRGVKELCGWLKKNLPDEVKKEFRDEMVPVAWSLVNQEPHLKPHVDHLARITSKRITTLLDLYIDLKAFTIAKIGIDVPKAPKELPEIYRQMLENPEQALAGVELSLIAMGMDDERRIINYLFEEAAGKFGEKEDRGRFTSGGFSQS